MKDESDLLRPELASLPPYNAGLSAEEALARPGVNRVAKLGSNENPLEPSPEARAAAAAALERMHVYPDPQGRALVADLASRHGCEPWQVVLGNGSEDLLAVLARAILRPGDRVVTLYPSFPLHEDYARLMGAEVERVGLDADGRIDVPALLAAVARPARLLLFSNPMNPAGRWLPPAELAAVLAAADPATVVCIDEAYHEYAEGPDYASAEDLLATHSGAALVLRTFSKAWGLAGLRIGYGLTSSRELRRGLDLARTPFNVNAPAQAAARAALSSPEAVAAAVALVHRERDRVAARLAALGLRVLPSKGNFLFFDAGRPSADLAEALLDRGVIVKPWKQDGYATWLRVSIGLESENDQFLEAMDAIVGSA
ncbi:MAG: histidinol-phosphate transaminase [Amaricoccus sp.]